MIRFLKILLQQFRLYSRTPEMVRLWALIGLGAIIVIINALFVPPYLAWVTIIIFLGIGTAIIVINLRLAQSIMELRFKKQEFQSLIEGVRDAVIIYDTNFKILTVNRSAEEIFQISGNELIGRFVDPSLIKSPHFRAITQVMFPSLAPSVTQISEAGVWPQIVNITLEDPKLELYTIIHRVTDDKGNIVGFLKLIKDRTREKAILQSKSEFISVTAHQLRTPLTAMGWSLETLVKMTENDRPELKNLIEETFELSQRTLKITNDILDVSKIEEGRFGYKLEEIDLIKMLKELVETALPVAKQYSIRLYFNPSGMESLKVQADQSRLSTAILNFIDNAIRYNVKNGKVTVSVQKLADKPFVKISIEDSGIGINTDDLNKLFQKFYRGANAVQVEPNGNGLGLFITRNVIKRHGGEVGAESAINRGSTFWLTLPLDPKLIPPKEFSYEESF
jgi:signal transduction histidine kinase